MAQRSGPPVPEVGAADPMEPTAGSHTLIVTASSSDGLSSSVTVSYRVSPPIIWLPLPAAGSIFPRGQVVYSWFGCADGAGGPGIASCVDQNGHGRGDPIDTS